MSKRISIPNLEKMNQTNYVCTQKLKLTDKIFGDKNPRIMEFDIFDGFAYCANFEGKEYIMTYPRKEFIKLSKDMEQGVREFLNLDDKEPITETHILQTYNTLHAL
jgi:hypothetical protein